MDFFPRAEPEKILGAEERLGARERKRQAEGAEPAVRMELSSAEIQLGTGSAEVPS